MSLEQLSNAITAYAFFTQDGVGDTGLTVTVDVYEGTTAGPIVTAANATELAGGFYYYTLASGSVDAVGAYLFLFKTTDASTDQKQIPAGWMIGTAGIENLDAPLSTIDTVVDAILVDTGTTLDTKLNTIDDFLDTEVAAILADTNELQTDWVNGGRLDLLIDAIKAKTDNISTAAVIADAVWDEATSGHTTAGTTSKAIIDILEDTATTIPGTITTLTGKVDTIDDFLDTEVAAILADTNELQTDWTNGGRLDLIVDAILVDTGTTLDGKIDAIDNFVDTEVAAILAAVDTEVAAIKAKTDNLPAAPAATGDIPTAAAIADAVWDEATSGHVGAGSMGKAVVDVLEDTATTIPGTLSTIAGYVDTEVAAVLAAVDTEVAAIKAKTDNIPAAPAAVGDIPTAASNADAVWDEAISGHLTAGTTGAALNAAGSAGDPWTTEIPGAYTGLQAGKVLADVLVDTGTTLDGKINTIDGIVDDILVDTGTTIPGTITTLTGKVDAVDDYVDTEVAAIKAVTDKLDTAVELDGAVYRFTANALEQAPTGGSAPTAADIADAVLDEAMSGHTTAGTLGKAIADTLEDTATTIPSTLSTIAGYIDTEVAAIKAKTDNLPTDPADQSAVEAAITAATSGLATSANLATVDTVVDAIKLKTDNLPTDPADQSAVEAAITAGTSPLATSASIAALNNLSAAQVTSAVPTVAQIADGVWDEATSGHVIAGSTGKALTDAAAGGTAVSAEAIADAVWDEALSGHATTGTTGAALAAAQSAGDPWATPLPGTYADGTAGALLSSIDTKLDTTAATVASSLTGTTLSVRRGDTFSVQFSGLGTLTGYTKIWFTVKRNPSHDDSESDIQVSTAGLLYLNGVAATAANGSITVNNATTGIITVVVDESETAKLGLRDNLYYDVQILNAGVVTTLTQGRANIVYDITRAVI